MSSPKYTTTTPWMKDLNAVGGIDTYQTYESPYSENPSANSIQGKNLTLGILPNSFEPPRLEPVSKPNVTGAMYRPRWSLDYRNPATIMGQPYQVPLYQYLGDENGEIVAIPPADVTPAAEPVVTPELAAAADVPAAAEVTPEPGSVETFRRRFNNLNRRCKEGFAGYDIPGLRGSEIVCESFCSSPGKKMSASEKTTCVVCVIVGIIIFVGLVMWLCKLNKGYGSVPTNSAVGLKGGKVHDGMIF